MLEAATKRSKAVARSITDRIIGPYVDDLRREIRSQSGGSAANGSASHEWTSDFVHNALHELRTIELEGVPKGARRVVSVGASGRWYFDWFERCFGAVDEHIGIEAFEQRPADLPDYVRWVASTADHFDAIADGSVDLVFAGQTTEHLWPHELAGFLLESKRVLAQGGLLVLDSPNRAVTDHLHWSHGGHTIELSGDEITELLELGGFDVERHDGIWACRFGDTILQLEEHANDPTNLVRRITGGAAHPDGAFIWWIDARTSERPAQPAALRRRLDELFAANWPTRMSRGMWPGPPADRLASTGEPAHLVTHSLPFPLHAGRWRLRLELVEGSWDSVTACSVRIAAAGGQVVHDLSLAKARGAAAIKTWELRQKELQFALELRVELTANSPVAVRMPIELLALPNR